MIEQTVIEETDAISILNRDESHFYDISRKQISGVNIQKKCSAFANADGGEFNIGIIDKKDSVKPNDILERWDGFANEEEANATIQNITQHIKPGIENINLEFLKIKNKETKGIVLVIRIEKSQSVQRTSEDKVWVRRGAQCLEFKGKQITDLELSKGAQSYEEHPVDDYALEELYKSQHLQNFLTGYSPKTPPDIFIKKQRLQKRVSDADKVIYAGILLYDDNPPAALPNKCAVKISRYDTSELIPSRDHLKTQETAEYCLIEQINKSIETIRLMVESVPIIGKGGLEKAKYPPEAIKEILVNAIIHRDYNISDDVQVFVFNNRIEVHSPGALPGNITIDNILDERFARNPKIVRLLNKYPEPPNKDIGEGLNTAFQKMEEVRLKPPQIKVVGNKVIVILPHETLASPETQIWEYLQKNPEINNKVAREITGIKSENVIKSLFYRLRDKGYVERVPNKAGMLSAWRKTAKFSPKPVSIAN